jgi:dephospho-CoA kinase
LDQVGHYVFNNDKLVLKQLEEEFGADIFIGAQEADSTKEQKDFKKGKRIINRANVAKIVFSDKSKIDILNTIMWPAIAEEQNKSKWFLDMWESGWHGLD